MAMRRSLWPRVTIIVLLLIAAVLYFWNWDWFKPLVEAQATAALGRKVTIQHFHVRLGRVTEASATGIVVANPDGFTKPGALLTMDRLSVDIDLVHYIFHQALILPLIEIDHPVADVEKLPDGENNYTLHLKSSGNSNAAPPQIGNLIINGGTATVVMPKTDFHLKIFTRAAPAGATDGGEIVALATGTYAAQPVTGQFTGGALLTLRDPAHPYPVDLRIQNGATHVSLVGTIQNPLTFGGANLRLSLSGQNMADLYALTNIPIPATPPYSISGMVGYTSQTIRFDHFAGRVGSSDLEGSIDEAKGTDRPMVTAVLTSRQVDLTDLAGFLGGHPGKLSTPGQNTATKQAQAKAIANPKLLPQQPFSIPTLKVADFDVRYHGDHIINKNAPLDQLIVHLIIKNGRITLDPLNFTVGTGTIISDVDLNPVGGILHTRANIDFRQLQLARLMAATHTFAGNGVLGGSAHLVATGNSVAAMLGHGNGGLQLFMNQGGNISALMVDLAGLQVGDAVLSALGIPTKTVIQCLISDFSLTDGQVDTKAFLIATPEANILGAGQIDLAQEKLALALRTEATHFSIGSLSTPINIGGTLNNPSILPAAGPLAARTVPAIGLGVLFPPLALLPTIRLGLGDKNACADTLQTLQAGNPHNPK